MFSMIYQWYIKSLSGSSNGGAEHSSNSPIIDNDGAHDVFDGMTDEAVDQCATDYGNAYRGAGVLIGILGALIIFCAVAPTGFSIESEGWLIFFGILKVAMMLMMAAIVFFGQRTHLKERWITARREAENRRYERLRNSKKNLDAVPSPENANALFSELLYCLVDKRNGQVGYNQSKAKKYKAIEAVSERISWVGFIVALMAALLLLASEFHLAPHYPVLIFFTAFVPAAVGCIHGINGFLNITALADEHEKMAKYLEGIYEELMMAQKHNRHLDPETIRSLAERAYSQLMDRDVQWAESVANVKLKPA